MKLERQVMIWAIALIVFVALLYLLREILLPFIAGMAIAYFLDPVADRLERWGLNRLWATSVILLLFLLAMVIAAMVIVPILTSQILAFAERLPSHVEKLMLLIDTASPDWLKQVIDKARADVQSSLGDVASKGAAMVVAVFGSVWSGGMAVINFISLIVLTPIVAFYLLYDWDRMIAKLDALLPRDHAAEIRKLAREIDNVMAGFVRGQGGVCLILAAFYALALTAVGLDFGLLIGLAAGLLSFIPFVGAIVGLVLSVGVALVQFWPDWVMVAVVLGIFLVGQAVEGNVLTPKLVGGSVGLHPVWLIFALFAFGLLFGFVGLLIAVPLAASLGVLVRFGIVKYRESTLYTGAGQAAGPKPRPRKSRAKRS